jgi:hypothetical protein
MNILYIFLVAIILLLIGTYSGFLLDSKVYSGKDAYLKYASAIFLIVIILGSIISWFLDCTFNLNTLLPTFGLEDRITLLG